MQCKICNYDCHNYYQLVWHIKKEHKISGQEYYNKYLKRENEEFCDNPNCNNKVPYMGLSIGYRRYCSSKCSMLDPINQANHKATCLKKYGVENPSQSQEIKNKKIQSYLKKYGRTCNLGIQKIVNYKKQRVELKIMEIIIQKKHEKFLEKILVIEKR